MLLEHLEKILLGNIAFQKYEKNLYIREGKALKRL